MASSLLQSKLARRESQIVDLLIAHGEMTAADIEKRLPGAPANATVRSLLRTLEGKKVVTHRKEGRKFFYSLAVSKKRLEQTTIKHLVDHFFSGSPASVVAALLDFKKDAISDSEIKTVEKLIADYKTKQKGRR